LLVYLGTLLFGFWAAFRRKDAVFFAFMLLIAVVSISENLLDVDKGIIFYAFFFTFFIIRNSKQIADNQPSDSKKNFKPGATKPMAVPSY